MFSRMVAAGIVICGLLGSAQVRSETTLDWSVKAFGDGQHNAFTDLILWHGQYYLCFRHGTGHLSMDGEIRVMKSADLKTWESSGTLDTFGDDRDPHFAATDAALYVFFGTWDLAHASGNGVPERHRLRSHFASSNDGTQWSKVQGVYEPDWWLWRVRRHGDAFYSVAYTLTWPASATGEARLLRSEDALNWSAVSSMTKDRMPDEADMRWLPDNSMEVVMRSCVAPGDAMLLRSDATHREWTRKDVNALIHSPVMAVWKDRCFVAGRGREGSRYVTRVWELTGDEVRTLITLPSDGDTGYPGLLVDPATADSSSPSLYISWYSQHERKPDAPNEDSIYAGRITVNP